MYNTYMLKNKFLSFILFFVITFSASFIGGLASISFKEPWYSQLVLSPLSPPAWVFGPVWTTLYVLMSIADVSFYIALTDAIVEPLANAVWYFVLDKIWTSKLSKKK